MSARLLNQRELMDVSGKGVKVSKKIKHMGMPINVEEDERWSKKTKT